MRRRVRGLWVLTAVAALVVSGCTTVITGEPQTRSSRPSGPVDPVAGHPRLFIREGDVERLRSWATPENPLWEGGVVALAERSKGWMDDGTIPAQDTGSADYETYPTELNAQLFAFMSLVDPDEAARADWGHRARELLMHVIGKAEAGVGAEGDPWVDPRFAVFNRSRWQGAAFPLTVDWAYPYFSADDRARIQKVFLRWAGEQFTAYPAVSAGGGATDFTRAGAAPDAALLADRTQVRWATNNYFTAHGRNLVLMALALDPADDPGGELASYLRDALNLWWYQTDHALRTEAAGGHSPEGTEYAQSSIAYMTQLGFALHTAGQADPARNGPQSVMGDNPFFAAFLPAQLHSIAPVPTRAPPELEIGEVPVYQPASFGDFERYQAHDITDALVPLGLYAADRGDRATLDAVRWYITDVSPGGAEGLVDRVGNTSEYFTSMWYFLALDPTAAPPADPRPPLPLSHAAQGLNRYSARTCWCPEASWFTYGLTWKTIDHQGSDANEFELYRRGEWLTKKHTGYDTPWYTDYHNTLTIENDPPVAPLDEPFADIAARGSQVPIVSPTDPTLVAQGEGEGWFYALGDATALYNWVDDQRDDVRHASRSVVWLQPDHVIVYDRAETATAGRFKRFWLNVPAQAEVVGPLATVRTPGGQQLFSTTLLPAGATITSGPAAPHLGTTSLGEPMLFQVQVDATGGPPSARFLHVVQGADGGVAADPATLVESTGGRPYAGAAVSGTAAVFPVDVGAEVDTTTVPVPAGVTRVLVTGLVPNAGYDVSSGGGQVTVTKGGSTTADAAGVVVVNP
ncbi:hypothetical protein [Pseudonocardia humida]|uniref:Heparinase II/III-like protein n=1 Tax=Pseudonocardia humida TaxID=2800819 RepID=A0ABT1A933_9PSEU|nr:hypothetical protein [Pseudonocardia humida]MCO1659433.1 hypothetical protein [Pseudonocardia humida]